MHEHRHVRWWLACSAILIVAMLAAGRWRWTDLAAQKQAAEEAADNAREACLLGTPEALAAARQAPVSVADLHRYLRVRARAGERLALHWTCLEREARSGERMRRVTASTLGEWALMLVMVGEPEYLASTVATARSAAETTRWLCQVLDEEQLAPATFLLLARAIDLGALGRPELVPTAVSYRRRTVLHTLLPRVGANDASSAEARRQVIALWCEAQSVGRRYLQTSELAPTGEVEHLDGREAYVAWCLLLGDCAAEEVLTHQMPTLLQPETGWPTRCAD